MKTIEDAAVFVATIAGGEVNSMGCLLEDGTLLTTLHSIFDLRNGNLYDLEEMKVFFVKNDIVYTYKIKQDGILHDGRRALSYYGHSASTFDYARLELESDPRIDLGPGLKLDETNYFGSCFSKEPSHTIAISGPIFSPHHPPRRIMSRSGNPSSQQSFYTFPQIGNHMGAAGMSGQAVLCRSPENGELLLYAVHVGCDHLNEYRTGFKISEYLFTQKSLSNPPAGRSRLDHTHRTYPDYFIEEANQNSRYIKKQKARHAEAEKSARRVEQFGIMNYAHVPVSALASHFRGTLGTDIFKHVRYTETNKAIYENPVSGWYVCYDMVGRYSTVRNKTNQYVALDGSVSGDGRGASFHFRSRK